MNRIRRAAEALGVRRPRNIKITLAKVTALLVAFMGLGLNAGIANAATLSSAKLTVGDSRPSTTNVNYAFTTSGITTGGPGAIKCVEEQYSDAAVGGSVPSGMDTTVGPVAVNTGASTYLASWTSWTLDKTTNGTLKYTNATTAGTPGSAGPLVFSVDGITNPSTADTQYYMHFNTYTGSDCATGPVDSTTVEYIYTDGSLMSLTVDDTLTFTLASQGIGACGAGGPVATVATSSSPNLIPFGTVTSASNAIACQEVSAATNATNGYTIYIRDNGQLSNALAQDIPDTGSTGNNYNNGSTNSAPAAFADNSTAAAPTWNQGGYGYSTDSVTLSGTANRFKPSGTRLWAAYGHSTDASGNGEVAYQATGVNTTHNFIAQQVGVTSLTQPGYYQTTVIYTCTPVY